MCTKWSECASFTTNVLSITYRVELVTLCAECISPVLHNVDMPSDVDW